MFVDITRDSAKARRFAAATALTDMTAAELLAAVITPEVMRVPPPRLTPKHVNAFTQAAAVLGLPAQDLVDDLVGWLTDDPLSPDVGNLTAVVLTNMEYATEADRQAAVDRLAAFLKAGGANKRTVVILTGTIKPVDHPVASGKAKRGA